GPGTRVNTRHKYHHFLLVLVVVAVAVGPVASAFSPARPRLQPALAQLAAQSPQAMLAVIVQKAGTSDAAATLATQLGGRITKDLHIINAFAVEMPGAAVLKLAQAESV